LSGVFIRLLKGLLSTCTAHVGVGVKGFARDFKRFLKGLPGAFKGFLKSFERVFKWLLKRFVRGFQMACNEFSNLQRASKSLL